jgi:hypothetical protein
MTQVHRYTKIKFASSLLILFAAAANAAGTRSDAAQDDGAWPVESTATISFGVPGFDDAPQVSASAGFVDPQAATAHETAAHAHAMAANDRSLQSPSSLTTTE